MTSAGELLRAARRRCNLSQRALALRAGTKQATISRLESGLEAPTLERLERLLACMGLRPVIELERLADMEPGELAVARALSHEERLRESMAWNLLTTQLETAKRR
jgi:transcriptional regulator with XRE-family HTH domain